jgi:hypothetical protein
MGSTIARIGLVVRRDFCDAGQTQSDIPSIAGSSEVGGDSRTEEGDPWSNVAFTFVVMVWQCRERAHSKLLALEATTTGVTS